MADEMGQDNLIQTLAHPGSMERMSAAEKLGDIRAIQAIDALVLLVKSDPASHVRWAAAEALGKIGDSKATKPLLEAFVADREIRAPIAGALTQLGDRSVVPFMVAALQHADSDIRDNAAYVLGELGGIDILYPLLQALKDEVPEVRYSAVEGLGTLGDIRALPALQDVAEHDRGESWNDFHGAPPGQSIAYAAKQAILKLQAK